MYPTKKREHLKVYNILLSCIVPLAAGIGE